jgi:hypothetical protein
VVRAVLWKEWREQATIIVALLAFGSGVIAAAVTFGSQITDSGPLEFRGYGEAGRLAFLMLALTAGTVIGGTLFAGEAEAGTTSYLAGLPVSRWRLWRAKIAAGLILTVLAGAVLIAVAAALGALGSGRTVSGWAVWSAAFILAAFGWGAFGSVLSRNTLTACGIGAISAPIFGAAFLILTSIAANIIIRGYGPAANFRRMDLAVQATLFFLFFAPLVLSGLIYSAPDRARRDFELTPGTIRSTQAVAREVGRRQSGFGVRALLWLLYRQYLVPMLVLAGLALLFGAAMLIEGATLLVGWPAVTLTLGVLVGVIGWHDEQGKGAARFWGERRLPVGRLWLAKVVVGMGVTLALALVFLLPSVIRAAISGGSGGFANVVFQSGLFAGINPWSGNTFDELNFLYFLLLWPVYGFAFGHLAGMLFEKAVVAAGVGLLAGGAFAILWLPSFFGGGLHHWQLWPVPVVIVLTARLIARAWAAHRVGSRRPIMLLVTSVILALGLTAAGLGYRVVEVPVTPQIEDDLAFAATVPPFEENLAGREIRTAIARYQQIPLPLRLQRGPLLFPEDPETPRTGLPNDNGIEGEVFRSQMYLVVKNGWPQGRPDLDEWMDRMFANEWDQPLYVAAEKPLGAVEDVTTLHFMSVYSLLEPLREMPSVLLARGLQQQARGDPAAFVRCFDATLSVARNTRNKGPTLYASIARVIERQAFLALDRWLERLDGQPDLLRQVLAALTRHEADMPTDPNEVWLADRTIVRNMVTAPSAWAEKYIEIALDAMSRQTISKEARETRAEMEASLLGFVWAVPWEKERLRRVVGLGNDPNRMMEGAELTRGAPGIFVSIPNDMGWYEPFAAADRRAAILRTALRLYEAETGKLPETLDPLVPQYLSAIPDDPFDNRPFRYRLSAGEKVRMQRQVPAWVPSELQTGIQLFFPPATGIVVSDTLFLRLQALAGTWVWGQLRPPGPPGIGPGELDDETFDAVAAVAGGVVQWPFPPLTPEAIAEGGAFPQFFSGLAGLAENVTWPADDRTMSASRRGILRIGTVAEIWSDPWWLLSSRREPPTSPRLLADHEYDAVAAAASGLVQWQLPPLTAEAVERGGAFPEEGGGFGGIAAGPGMAGGPGAIPQGLISSRRGNPLAAWDELSGIVHLTPGQGVVWSIGSDLTDDGGRDMIVNLSRNNVSNSGDLIYIVPLPAKKPPAPQP